MREIKNVCLEWWGSMVLYLTEPHTSMQVNKLYANFIIPNTDLKIQVSKKKVILMVSFIRIHKSYKHLFLYFRFKVLG